MSQFTAGTAWNVSLKGSDLSITASKKITIPTASKYLDRNIEITIPKGTDIVGTGSATTPTASAASTSTSLSGTTLTVARSVTPTVVAGYVSSGTSGTVTITGTVPTQSKAASGSGTVSPDSGKLLSSVTVAAAATPALAITDQASTNLTVGTLASGYYPFTTSLTGKMTYGTAGWITTGGSSATDSSVTVGRLPAAAGSVTMTAGAGVLTKSSGITTSTSDTYSCGFSLSGKGSVSATAKITTAGYTPTNTSFATGASTSSNASTTEYITGLTIPSSKTFGSSSAKGAITLNSSASAYMTMNSGSTLYLTDSVTGKTWTIKCDSTNNALSIQQ